MVFLLLTACTPNLEELLPFPCAHDGSCPAGLACIDRECAQPALGSACQAGTRCESASTGAVCHDGRCATLPASPMGVEARRVVDSVRVSWTAPASTGGLPLLGYHVRGEPGGLEASTGAEATSVVLQPIGEGVTYTFTVAARNALGASAAAASSPLTIAPPSAPTSPRDVSATAGVGQAQVRWSAPLDDGGRAVTHYTVTVTPGGATQQVDAESHSATVTGLRAGTGYRFTVSATNEKGTSPESAPSNEVTPAARVPAAPTEVVATGESLQARVTWSVPSDDGGSAITRYTVTADPGGAQVEVGGGTTEGVVTGLSAGGTYSFTVSATNSAGTGPDSSPSPAVVVLSRKPGAPTAVVATAAAESAHLTWAAPADDGGGVITGYRITSSAGGSFAVGAATLRATATGLTPGASYTFTVAAINSAGTGPESAASNTVTPRCFTRFTRLPTLAVTSNPAAMVSADFNGDGLNDLVVANVGNANLGVYLAKAGGTFHPRQEYSKGSSNHVAGLAAADLNGDNKLDLLLALQGSELGILLGNGDGTFRAATRYPGAAPTPPILTADLDGDGALDVIAGFACVWPGNGDGTVRIPYCHEGGSYGSPALGDFNGDGKVDLAQADAQAGVVGVFLGRGDGTFDPPVNYPAASFVWSVVTADFNGDQKPDLAAIRRDGAFPHRGTLFLYFGKGDGTFHAAVEQPIGRSPIQLLTADFNLDGHADLAVMLGTGSRSVGVLLGNGNGTFRPRVEYVAGTENSSLLAADVDGDGTVDLVVSDYEGSTLTLLHGVGDGSFRATAVYPAGDDLQQCVVGDFDGDGRADLAAPDAANGVVAVLLGGGDASFEATASWAAGAAPSGAARGDFDGDGKLDLAVANKDAGTLSILLGNGAGGVKSRADIPGGEKPVALVTADFNRDGKIDLAVANLDQPTVGVLLGNGDGTFRQRVEHTVYGTQFTAMVAGDVNADGIADLAIGRSYYFTVLAGTGDGGFVSYAGQSVGGYVTAVLLDDFNRDGRDDLALGAYGGGGRSLSVRFSQASGGFDAGIVLIEPEYGDLGSMVSGDFDGDGATDLVTLDPHSGTFSLFRGKGDGTFRARVSFPSGEYPRLITSADFTGDGVPDLAITTDSGGVAIVAPECVP